MKTKNSNAFTLIEMLVVIAIITILAAILFPVFAQARAKARESMCLSNTKQIAVAMTIYYQDYSETTPYLWRDFGAEGYPGWAQRIYPYTKNSKIFFCPNGPKCNPTDIMGKVLGGGGGNMAGNPHLASGLPIAQLNRPSDLVVLAETGVWDWLGNGQSIRSADTTLFWGDSYSFWGIHCGQNYDAYDPAIVKATLTPFAINWRHQNGANFVFADGHARHKTKGSLIPENFYFDTPPPDAYTPCNIPPGP